MATRTSTRVRKAPEKQPSPSFSSSEDDAPQVKRSTKRSRPMAPVDSDEEAGPTTPRPAKKTRTTKTPAQITAAAAEKAKLAQEKLKKKASKDKAAAEKRAEKEAASAKKNQQKQCKEIWRVWVINNDAGDERFKADPTEHDTLTQTNCKKFYGVTPEELKTLAHDEVFNSHNPKMPGKIFKREQVQRLAFRKSAVLAGVEEKDDEELVKKGKVIFEGEHG
jgi:hypothetical protein